MKRFLPYFFALLTFVLGYFVRGWFSETHEVNHPQEIPVEKTQLVQIQNDKIEEKKNPSKSKSKKSKKQDSKKVDSLELKLTDTLSIDTVEVINTDTLIIKRDKLLFSKTVSVAELNKNRSKLDSLKQFAMGIQEKNFNQKIVVEYWESPFQFTGYKLGKSKLILYGFNPHSEILLEEKGKDTLKLIESGEEFNFVKSQDFRTIPIVKRDSI